jgi:hypothetical protein
LDAFYSSLAVLSYTRGDVRTEPYWVKTTDDQWRNTVESLILRASLIFVCPDVDSAGIWWEVERVFNDAPVLAKSIFVMPPLSSDYHHLRPEVQERREEAARKRNQWESVASRIKASFKIEFPEAVDEGLLFAIDGLGGTRMLGGPNNTNLESTRHVLEYLLAVLDPSGTQTLHVSIRKKHRYILPDEWSNDPDRYKW